MSAEAVDVPYYLMPVAALLAMYALLATCRAVYLVFVNFRKPSSTTTNGVPPPVVSIRSRPFFVLSSSIVVAIVLYAKIVATIDKAMKVAENALFDPYEILGVTESIAESNRTHVQQQYRQMVKLHHPDKGGDAATFHRIHLAYKTLTDETARRQYELYGHPDGQVTVPTLEFALPSWLLRPTGTMAITLVILYIGMFVGIIVWVVSYVRKEEKQVKETLQTMSVALGDMKYFAHVLSPNATHLDILLAVASTPENIEWAVGITEKEDKMRRERLAQLKSTSSSNKKSASSFELDQAGWADEGEGGDGDEEEETERAKAALEKAKQAEIEKEKQRKELELATGKVHALMEGIDDGVIGQAWVEKVLAEKGQWPPPDLRFLAGKKFEYKGKQYSAMEHPGVRRALLITIGRLNSQSLNTHPELLEAGAAQKVDQSYFRTALEYRQRAGILLEAVLRLAISLKSYPLTSTIIEAVTVFRLGVPSIGEQHVREYKSMMQRQHVASLGDDETGKDLQFLPRLQVLEKSIETPGEDEIATGDSVAINMSFERLHAEGFTRQKMAVFQKQGLPPQLALAQYIEGWWLLVRAIRVVGQDDDDDGKIKDRPTETMEIDKSAITETLDAVDVKKFQSQPDRERLYTAWPMIVQNIAQKNGKAKVQFTAPSIPGKYQIIVSIKSQDFLGADQEVEMEVDIVDVATVQRKEAADEDEEEEDEPQVEGDDEAEPKKDK